MYVYDFGPRIQTLGQGPLVSSVGGVQQVSSDGAKLLQALFTNKYPYPTGAFSLSTGAATPTAFDANADLLGYQTVDTSAAAGGTLQTVYDQLQSMPDKSLFLIDVNSAQGAIAGSPNPVVYAIAKNPNVVNVVAREGSSYARLLSTVTGAQPGAPAPKKATSAAPIVAGLSIAALIAILAASA
jgi:hypothetical protein